MTASALRIIAILSQPVVSYHGLHFDGILAHAIVERETGGAGLPQTTAYVPCHLPLLCVWRSATGVPLWASTDLLPEGAVAHDVIYQHRRALEPTMTRANLKTGKGRYKERRSPLPALAAPALVAYAVGDAQEIASLLAGVTSIGKKRVWNGAVLQWKVEEVDDFSFIDEQGRARRPIPHEYWYCEEREGGVILSFSPPYWHVATRARCIPPGVCP